MFPQIVITPDEKYVDIYIHSMQEKYGIPDSHIYRYYPVKKEFSIDLVRDIKRSIVSATQHPRLITLFAFHTASQEAQNALLKTIEESTSKTLFLMIVNHPDALVSTLQSRSILVSLNQTKESHTQEPELSTEDLINLQPSTPLTRDAARGVLIQQISSLRKLLPTHPHLVPIIKKAIRFTDLLIRNNIQPQLAVDTITLDARRALATPYKNR